MQLKHLRWWHIGILAGGIIAAFLLINSESEQELNPNSLVRSILTHSPCAPPCWQGIVPGTSMEREQIVQKLEIHPNVVDISDEGGATIRWIWEEWPHSGTALNSIYLTPLGIVQNIRLSVDFDLTVGEIVDKYGVPEAMFAGIAGVESRYIAVHLYYPTKGIEITAQIQDETTPILESITEVYVVHYTVPAESFDSWLASFEAKTHIQPWSGYGVLTSVYDAHQ